MRTGIFDGTRRDLNTKNTKKKNRKGFFVKEKEIRNRRGAEKPQRYFLVKTKEIKARKH